MVHACHAIMTAYGFWLPNDPRGSWSNWIRRWELLQYGKATKVTTPSPWARKSWPVFLDTDEEICRAVRYVQQNPIRDGKPKQRWSFVVPFEPTAKV